LARPDRMDSPFSYLSILESVNYDGCLIRLLVRTLLNF
jgi:hypothetical protein